jgi:hypothetical protein
MSNKQPPVFVVPPPPVMPPVMPKSKPSKSKATTSQPKQTVQEWIASRQKRTAPPVTDLKNPSRHMVTLMDMIARDAIRRMNHAAKSNESYDKVLRLKDKAEAAVEECLDMYARYADAAPGRLEKATREQAAGVETALDAHHRDEWYDDHEQQTLLAHLKRSIAKLPEPHSPTVESIRAVDAALHLLAPHLTDGVVFELVKRAVTMRLELCGCLTGIAEDPYSPQHERQFAKELLSFLHSASMADMGNACYGCHDDRCPPTVKKGGAQ